MKEKSLGLTVNKNENFSRWYNDVVLKVGLADFASIKGFMVIKPYGYAIWEKIKAFLDFEFKKTGHSNAYFPCLIPDRFFEKEKEHVKGFKPEVFWVTEAGDSKLRERYALRPTSETIIYDSYSRWIRSWRDLPILINVWANVFRSETKMTKLFLRTREFLWQEGHTCHRNKEEADEEVMKILDIYKKMCEELLAIPVISGIKTESEKFPGALYTATIEALMPDGKALQLGTSHNLGQHFAKAFNIQFADKDKKKKYVWQTCWGVSTRLIGAAVMVHGDDKGLVLPPKIAPIQIVIIPIIFKKYEEKIKRKAKDIKEELEKKFSVELDDRDYSPGYKFHEWEMKGVPLRIEIGPKDLANNSITLVRRDSGKKESVKISDLEKIVKRRLDEIQKTLYDNAKKFLDDHTFFANNIKEFEKFLHNGFVKANWCGSAKCESSIKEKTTATIRCLPLKEKEKKKEKGKCIVCGKDGSVVYFARAY